MRPTGRMSHGHTENAMSPDPEDTISTSKAGRRAAMARDGRLDKAEAPTAHAMKVDDQIRLAKLAPEMLRELKSAIFYIESYGGDVTDRFAAGGNLAHIKAVIAKAEGKA